MYQYRSEFFVEDANGAELKYDLENRELTYITVNGDVGAFRSEELYDLLVPWCIYYHHIPGICFLLFGDEGEEIYRFDLARPELQLVERITRTELMNEGFDYNEWLDHPQGPILYYELGICAFDTQGKMRWHTRFDFFLVRPKVRGQTLVYSENEGDHIYSIQDGSLLDSPLQT